MSEEAATLKIIPSPFNDELKLVLVTIPYKALQNCVAA